MAKLLQNNMSKKDNKNFIERVAQLEKKKKDNKTCNMSLKKIKTLSKLDIFL
jgi:hypothetical protein